MPSYLNALGLLCALGEGKQAVADALLAAGIQPGRDVLIQTQSRSEVSPYIEF